MFKPMMLSLVALGVGLAQFNGPVGLALGPAGELWVANVASRELHRFTPEQLGKGDLKPSVVIRSSGALGDAPALVFDPQGNLWAANFSNATVIMYTPPQLSASGAPVPARVLTAGFKNPNDLLFDASGGLWVSDNGNNTLSYFSAAQVAAAGQQTPSVLLQAGQGSLDGPASLSLDRQGRLWVANYSGNSLVAFAPEQLGRSGSPTPRVTLRSAGLNGPTEIAFDASGGVWVPNANGGNLVYFAAGQLERSGSPSPDKTLSANPAGALASPNVVLLTPDGGLWVSGYVSNTVLRFAAADVGAGGSATPSVWLGR
ncbi:MAG: NHL repeat-containing protein [Meiothermus sp.]|nr:NHL repeat-containing protein [Meiothermus sp.]